ncbi:choline dehydrogenase [Labedella phragmitis]|uniref:Choline dehydrogenase n=1 Tax=Labedella phragmitis TaxID=2498849 RepID=A0A444PYD2_9MICO|nr:GMC oxidoreductase [Labedella phragmitis]RWZ52886.1 choline dehydrogenase [Labedella phragmitis]
MHTPEPADLLIVGSGLMGAAVARCVREQRPDARIVMIAGGPNVGPIAGQHLHDVTDPDVWDQYNKRVASGVQAFYTGVAPTAETGATMRGVTPGMYHLSSLGEAADEMPSASVAWNAGGMGIHWTAATPFPWGSEINPHIAPDEWEQDLNRAAQLLRVNPEAYPQTEAGAAVVRALAAHFDPRSAPGRGVQDMPMAVNADETGLKIRTSPFVIFPPIGAPGIDGRFTLVPDTIATSILHENGRAIGAECRDIETGALSTVHARQVVVCADTVRTPQLLFASGIRPDALGRYLNEHFFLTGIVDAAPDRLGFDLTTLEPPTDHEWASDCLWVPHSDAEQPFQVHLMNKVVVDDEKRPVGYGVGIEYYIRTEIQRDNRLEFSDDEVDATGMPRITVHFRYSDADRANLELARADQAAAARLLGDFDPETQSAVLGAGGSLHLTGTVRMGRVDDGTSVCDLDCRVWGFDNLFVAGNGVIPTALVCNSTLTGMTTAVRAAAAVVRALA